MNHAEPPILAPVPKKIKPTAQQVPKRKFAGVQWRQGTRDWACQIKIKGKTETLGCFDKEEDAARKYDEAAEPLGRPLNFPREGELSAAQKRFTEKPSKWKGVCWNSQKSTWKAQITVNGKLTYLGSFSDEIEAALKYDEVAASLGRRLNKPIDDPQKRAEVKDKKK